MSLLQKFTDGLKKTSDNFKGNINNIFNKSKAPEEILSDLEDFMISSDIGLISTEKILNKIKEKKFDKQLFNKESFLKILRDEMISILKPCESNNLDKNTKLQSIIVCGVNGTGKTTTVGKLSKILKNMNKKIIVGACDTFRAAAIDQLEKVCNKNNVEVFKSNEGADPASVAYKTMEYALSNKFNTCIIDTAGRLHNKKNLMDEFSKIIRVIKKVDENAPHEIIIVLDATTGQNAMNQVTEFNKICNLSRIIMTKLDGTAKGGVLITIIQKFKLPIYAIGIGEKPEDLHFFDAEKFVEALLR